MPSAFKHFLPKTCGDGSLSYLGQFCSGLKRLEAYQNPRITDAGMLSLAMGCRKISEFRLTDCQNLKKSYLLLADSGNLRSVYLKWMDAGDEEIQILAEQSPNLTSLEIVFCNALSDKTAEALTKNCRELRHLSITGLKKVSFTDDGIETLVKGCTRLSSLKIDELSPVLTNGALIAIGNRAQHLRKLILVNNNKFTAEGVSALTRCPRLEVFELHRCRNIGDELLQFLAENPHRLKKLELNGCSKMQSTQLLEKLARSRRGLVIEILTIDCEFNKDALKDLARRYPNIVVH